MKLSDGQMSEFFHAADRASAAAQRATLTCNFVRLFGIIAAAVGGGFSVASERSEAWAGFALAGFVAALVAEIFLVAEKPERGWYQARAAAESAKTLSWGYAVGADPFFVELADSEAEALYRSRISEIATQVSQSVAMPRGDVSAPTDAMRSLRASSFEDRRNAYLRDRTTVQRNWYTEKAETNRRAATRWRIFLIMGETVAVVLAAGGLFVGWRLDLAGVLAAVVGAGAAWLALKQHVSLRAAYALTAAELEKQMSSLRVVTESDWAAAVADAEEAISREHTMWLASRGEVNEVLS